MRTKPDAHRDWVNKVIEESVYLIIDCNHNILERSDTLEYINARMTHFLKKNFYDSIRVYEKFDESELGFSDPGERLLLICGLNHIAMVSEDPFEILTMLPHIKWCKQRSFYKEIIPKANKLY